MKTTKVLLGLVVSMLLGTANAAVAHDGSSGNPPVLHQSISNSEVSTQSGSTMDIPLLVLVGGNTHIMDIQHAQRLPPSVDKLLWKSVNGWVKSPAIVNGRRTTAQVLMHVTLHEEPQADGLSKVYFTLASMGPVMRGQWRMYGDKIVGWCSLSGNASASVGGKGRICSRDLTAMATPKPTAP